MILCDDKVEKEKKLNLRGLPVASTYTIFQPKEQARVQRQKDATYWILADPDTFEEGLCDESVTVTPDCSRGEGRTRILGIEKVGGCVVGREEMRWKEWAKVLLESGRT